VLRARGPDVVFECMDDIARALTAGR
jgi:hypothetical protein